MGACASPAGSVSSGGHCKTSAASQAQPDHYGQPAHGAVRRATASQAIRRGPILEGEEGELREQFDRVAVLYQRVSPRAGQDKS